MKKILIPTDFSSVADNATKYALYLANVLESELVFIHAEEYNIDSSKAKLKEELYTLTGSNFHPNTNFLSTDRLFNSETMKNIIRDNNIDLFVMGTDAANKSLTKNIFGSHASEIIDNIACPVIIIPSDYHDTSICKIGYASDLNTLNDDLVKVINFARPFNAAIEVFHVSPIFPDLGDVEKMDVKSSIETLRERNNYTDIHYSKEINSVENQINKGINRFQSQHNLDLLVLFHEPNTGMDRFITSSETESAIKQIKRPLLIFPKGQ